MTFNKLEGFSSITSLEHNMQDMQEVHKYLMAQEIDPEIELLKFILLRMKETTHSHLWQDPFGDDGKAVLEPYIPAKGLFPTI